MKKWHTQFKNYICNNNGDILVQKNDMKNQNFAFSRHISVKKNEIFIVVISLDRVNNQYLKCIGIRI